MTQEYRRIDCPKCEKRLKIKPDWNPERSVKCPQCKHSFRIAPKRAPAKPQQVQEQQQQVQAEYAPQPQPAARNNSLTIAIVVCTTVILVVGITLGAKFLGPNPATEEKTAEVNNTQSDSKEKKSEAAQPAQNKAGQTNGTIPVANQNSQSPNNVQPSSNSTSNVAAPQNNQSAKTDEDRPTKNPVQVEPGEFGLGLEGELKGEIDDPNRPQFNPNAAEQFDLSGGVDGGLGNAGGLSGSTFAGNGGSTTGTGGQVPALNVLIEPEVKSLSVMRVDYQSDPGVSAKFTVSLDKTPMADITIKITTEQGLTVDTESLTFTKNVQPERHTITISGDGKANMGSDTSKIMYMTVTASGGGFDATGPAKVPVQVVKRTQWVAANGNWLERGDAAGSGDKTEWFAFAIPRKPATSTDDYYTHEYVELLGPGGKRKARFYSDRVEIESAPNSGTFKFLANGNWY